MSITVAMRTQVSQLYVSLFGRAPDGEGLGYWVGQLAAGKTMAQVAQDMFNVDAARAYYPSWQTNDEIVAAFYVNVLGRTADAEGQAYWVGQMNAAGATKGSVITSLISAVVNYTGTDAAALKSKALFANKVEVAQYYGEKSGTVAGATAVLAGVTDAVATVTAGKSVADGGSNAGQTFMLTANADIESGTSGNDTFSGTAGTVDGDVLAGGAGTDTLNLTVTIADDDGVAFTATDIETISIRSTGGTAADAALIDIEMGDATGVETLEFRRINDDIQIANLQSLDTTIVMTSNATTADVVVGFETSVVSGTADTANVTIDSTTGGADLTINGVETIAVTVSGEDNDLNVDGDDLETVTVTGAGDLNMDVDASVTTFDASSSTGGVRVNFTAAADVAATGGSGNDTFSIGALLTADDVIDGGDGTDTLILDNAGAALAAIPASAQITNVETLRLEATDDSAVDAFTLNASRVAFDTITIDVSDENDTYAITNYTDETINIVESANNAIDLLDVSFADATGTADSLTVNVTNNDTTTALTVDDIASTGGGIETLRLVLNQGADIDDASDILVDDVSIAADTLEIAGAADATLGTTVNLTIAEIDASESTGDLTLELGAATHDVTSGSGDDTIDFNGNLTSTDSVDGGAGDDTLVAALAAGTAAATLANIESATLEFGTAGATFSGVNADTNLTSITIDAASDEAVSLVNLKSSVASVRIGATGFAADAASIGYASGASGAHEVIIGDNTATPAADVDAGVITISGNSGALTVTSDAFTGNSVYAITANTATSLAIVTEEDLELDAAVGTGILAATAATSVTMTSDGGALLVDGAQTLTAATAITINAADGNITLTGAMTATRATTLTVTATDDFLQTGNFVSDADVTEVNLTASGISSSIRYDGILDVDHVRAINLTAVDGGTVTVDDIEMLGLDNDAATDIDTSLTISATGTDTAGDGSTVTVSAINVAAAATLDSVTITSDADGTVNFTVGGANLTITAIDASASAGTLVFDSSTSGAAIDLTTGSGDNTITTELDQADVITLASAAGTDTIIVLDDTTAADVVTNFEAGASGDVISIDVSALGTGAETFNSVALSSALVISIGTDADGVLADADNAVTANTNILRLTNTFADIDAVVAAIDLDAEANAGGLLDNDVILVLWTDGASSYVSTVTLDGAAGAAADAGANLVELVGVSVSDLTAANFAFV